MPGSAKKTSTFDLEGTLRPQTLPFRVQITRAKPAQSVKFPAPAAIKEQIQARAAPARSLSRKYYKVSVFPEIYPASFRHHVAARGLSFSRLRRSMPASWLWHRVVPAISRWEDTLLSQRMSPIDLAKVVTQTAPDERAGSGTWRHSSRSAQLLARRSRGWGATRSNKELYWWLASWEKVKQMGERASDRFNGPCCCRVYSL